MRASEILNETQGKKYYHGSYENLPVGTRLTPGNDDYEDNWGENLWYDALEYWRPNEYLAHRAAVFMVDNEDDVDMAGGATDYLLTVIPRGKIQRHDMNWGSEIGGMLEDDDVDYADPVIENLALNYWNGVPHTNESVWEYLAPEAIVVAVEPY